MRRKFWKNQLEYLINEISSPRWPVPIWKIPEYPKNKGKWNFCRNNTNNHNTKFYILLKWCLWKMSVTLNFKDDWNDFLNKLNYIYFFVVFSNRRKRKRKCDYIGHASPVVCRSKHFLGIYCDGNETKKNEFDELSDSYGSEVKNKFSIKWKFYWIGIEGLLLESWGIPGKFLFICEENREILIYTKTNISKLFTLNCTI